jgi:phosphomannomutase/phosphoglucomutase
MVTGSHNPGDYNGLKIVLGGETLAGEAIQQIRARVEAGSLRRGAGSVRARAVLQDYVARVADGVRVARPLRVVVDCGSGVAGVVAPALYRRLGCEVIELFCEVDGRFPHHHPDPSQPANLRALIAQVRAAGADLGLAFDGDGDRLGVVDEQGQIIWPDRQLMLFAREVLQRHPGAAIIYDVKCTGSLDRVIREAGGSGIMWKTGHSLIKKRMAETGALLAGEMSGHIFFREGWYGFDDALYAGARLLALLAQGEARASAVFGALPDAMSTPELHVQTGEGEHFRLMEALGRRVDELARGRFAGAQVSTLDGLRVDFADRWGLVRASNTTSCLVLRFEGDSAASLERVKEEFRGLLRELDADLDIRF